MDGTKFQLFHVGLYCKGWYERKDLIEDLKKCLEADNYDAASYWVKEDVARVLLDKTLPFVRNQFEFFNLISPKECWKTNYYTKDHTWIADSTWKNWGEIKASYDYWTAVIYACMSAISIMDGKDFSDIEFETIKQAFEGQIIKFKKQPLERRKKEKANII